MTLPDPTRPWPASVFPGILFGADYNPEQWTPAMGYAGESVWLEDMRLMRAAGVNVATVGVFSWAELEPGEGRFAFGWMDRLLDLLAENGIRACLGTATAAQPAWLSQAYPDALPVDEDGRRRRHGGRMNFCPTSPDFRRLAQRLARALAERYHDHPALLIWHVSNEYGPHCFCERCAERFRAWLQARYGTLEALNAAWVTPFWSHTLTAWEQVEPPLQIGERSMQGHLLDYQRFMSDMNLECYRGEAAVLREVTPGVPVMTNFHGLIKGLDYASWAPHLDIVAWDSYPAKGEPPAHVAFRHSIMRGLRRGQPWLLLEQTPSQTQWRPYNPLKRPGEMRLQSYQALAHGADSVMFFQWRQSRGSAEMHHGAIVSHAASDRTRVFREVAALGAELRALGTQTLGARVPAEVALLFSWPSWWAVEYQPGLSAGIRYLEETTRTFAALWAHNIAVDVVDPDAPLEGYKLVVAPLLHMVSEAQAAAIEGYVAGGGAFLTTFFSGIVGEDGRAWLGGSPGPLRRTLGVWVEEVDPLLPGEANRLCAADEGLALEGACDLWCEVVHLEGARALAVFGEDFYAGRPALTEHRFGEGRAYYLATRPEAALLERLMGQVAAAVGIRPPLVAPAGVEVVQRRGADSAFIFVLNHHAAEQTAALPEAMRDLLSGAVHQGEIRLAGRGVAILVPEA
ncbi:MAG TPA: beta-galactosidase [Roseiflexaceae bacterium]|nr:beta-galactosidase [Roseiflexaceae bacterium]